MFKCIKDVFSEYAGEFLFKEGQLYCSQGLCEITGYKVIDETESLHIIGRSGEDWFDEHFREAEQELKNEINTNDRKKKIADSFNKACVRNGAALRKLSDN